VSQAEVTAWFTHRGVSRAAGVLGALHQPWAEQEAEGSRELPGETQPCSSIPPAVMAAL